MIFRSQIDKYYTTLFAIIIIVIAAFTLLPVIIDDNIPPAAVITLVGIFLVTTGLIGWNVFSIKYIFRDDHLHIKGGFFRSRIQYEDITKVTRADEILTGYRPLTSKDAIEIFYRTAYMGSAKISPKNQAAFIKEIQKRCPHAEIDFKEERET